jgi:hypothetical protein
MLHRPSPLSPSVNASQRLNGLGAGMEVVADRVPLIAGDGLLTTFSREIDRYPGVRDALVRLRPAITAQLDIRSQNHVARIHEVKLKLKVAFQSGVSKRD